MYNCCCIKNAPASVESFHLVQLMEFLAILSGTRGKIQEANSCLKDRTCWHMMTSLM